ncbi:hypothetical protein CH373_14310 [Leptospira perolatii]|uniref:CAAX prenyl protease 2/Lysostaphin resistance protein A-like domain-containing protein n=1 Tax=Leptospira perolatii TaxID=2023191 RepID=A0A2M9ZJY9_9LEPT|nr:CPBP family glutamic-type intramembrane protease [Leptospira perolatii]PJZ69287.1 hypothetical protein CH360_12310 [Leptospira perolatii]PJZ72331.1 hypothetical protein CH373_14310 [Leptospira perolatii]
MEITLLQPLGDYILRVLPALAITVLFWISIKPDARLRILIYILLFVLFRDAMTGARLWAFGSAGGFWIRLSDSPPILILLGFFSLAIVVSLWKFDSENREWILWVNGNKILGITVGILSGILVALPIWFLNRWTGSSNAGGIVSSSLYLPLLWFALVGNLYEEFLFRGYIRGIAEEKFGWVRASIISGVSFSFFHIFLATTVSSVGLPLLAFALWEGVICGFIASKWGIVSSTITHGFGIWILATGIA